MRHEPETRRLGGNPSERRRTAERLRAAARYDQAATEFEAAKDFVSAARCFEHVGDYEQAAVNYLRAGDHAQAGDAYRLAGNPVRAARMYERAGNFAFAAQLFREANELPSAARCFQRMGEASSAGEMYERAGQMLLAAEAFLEARLFGRAARAFEEAGAWTRAADAWSEAGDRGRSAAARRRSGGRDGHTPPPSPAAAHGVRAASHGPSFDTSASDRDAMGALFRRAAQRGYLSAADEQAIERFEHTPVTRETLPFFLELVRLYRTCALDERCRRLCNLIREEALGIPDLESALAVASAPAAGTPTPVLRRTPDASLGASFEDAPSRATPPGWTSETPRRPTPATHALDVPRTVTEIREGDLFDGRYRVLRKLGAGTIGAVFMARDERLDETVALKVLKPMQDVGEDVVGRFKQEIKITRRIVHPGVVRTYDFGECGALPYLSMEYVDGRDLRHRLREVGRFAIVDGLRIVRAVCAALEAAHRLDVVHRDIKPENILLDTHGDAKLIDFGIAKFKDAVSAVLTETSIGTPEYVSPEMALGQPVDRRTDLYSVGAVMYEIFCGVPPFRGGNLVSILTRQVSEMPRAPRTLVPELPVRLEAAILKALAKDPSQRHGSAAELDDELALLDC
ncbi:MAG: protein kinase [bacterium]